MTRGPPNPKASQPNSRGSTGHTPAGKAGGGLCPAWTGRRFPMQKATGWADVARLHVVLFAFSSRCSLLSCLGSPRSGEITAVGFLVPTEGTQPKAQGTAPHSVTQGVWAQSPDRAPSPSHPAGLGNYAASEAVLPTPVLLGPQCVQRARGSHSSTAPSSEASAATDSEQETKGGAHSPVPPPISLQTSGLKMNKPMRKNLGSLGELQQCGL